MKEVWVVGIMDIGGRERVVQAVVKKDENGYDFEDAMRRCEVVEKDLNDKDLVKVKVQ